MKRFRLGVLVAVFLAAGYWVALFAQEDRRRGGAKLPATATDTLQRLYPGAEVRDLDVEGEGAERIYKVEARLANKRGEVTLKFLADGLLIEIKEERETETMPDAVRKSLARAFPKGRASEVRVITRTVVTYEVEMREDDRKREVTLSPRGKILEIEKR